MQIFLASRSNETSYKNFLSTIKDGVDFSVVEPYLNKEGKEILRKFKKLFAWGTKETKKSSWDKMRLGDLVIFYKGKEKGEKEGKFIYAGRLLYKQHSKDLGLSLWPSKKREKPWTCVFFLTDLKPIYLPISEIIKLAGYRDNFIVQGFMHIKEIAIKKILEKFETIDNFTNHYLMEKVDENINYDEKTKKSTEVPIVQDERLNIMTKNLALNYDFKTTGIKHDDDTISEILKQCNRKRWVLPRFQRYFEWKKEKIKDLLDSIFHGYYIGSFLLWEVRNKDDLEIGIQPIAGVKGECNNPDFIMLDGQQRITALYYAFISPENIELRKSERTFFYLDLNSLLDEESNEGELILIEKNKLATEEIFKKSLFPLQEISDFRNWSRGYQKFLNKKYGPSKFEKINEITRRIEDKLRYVWNEFKIPYVYLSSSTNLKEAATIFERINTSGKVLTIFDLSIARMYKDGIDLKKLWEETKEKYSNIKRYDKHIEDKIPIYILQAIALQYTDSSSCKKADLLNLYNNAFANKQLSFEKCWEATSEYMNRAIEKLESFRSGYGFGVKDEKALPFDPTLPVLAALIKEIELSTKNVIVYNKLNQWYWSAIFSDWYVQGADGKKTTDYKEIKRWFNNDDAIPNAVVEARKYRLDFFNVKTQSSALYKGVMSLFAIEGAKDFATGQTLENARKNDKDHIYPKKIKGNKYIDSVLNMTWLSDETNKIIKRDKKPSVYIAEFIKSYYKNNEKKFIEDLKTHFIDKDGYTYLKKDDKGFLDFIKHRNELIINRIKILIGESDSNRDKLNDQLISPERPFGNELQMETILSECDDYIYWVDKYFSIQGLNWIYEKINRERVKNIKILMSYKKVTRDLRKRFKDFRIEMEKNNIKCDFKVMNKNDESQIHDRWIITLDNCFNIPSPDVIARGQYSEIKETVSRPPFENWWRKGLDIIKEWNKVEKLIEK